MLLSRYHNGMSFGVTYEGLKLSHPRQVFDDILVLELPMRV